MQTLSLQQAAAMLNTTPETVSAMIRNERLPAAKVGRAWVLVDVDIIRWLRGRYAREEKQCGSSEEVKPMSRPTSEGNYQAQSRTHDIRTSDR